MRPLCLLAVFLVSILAMPSYGDWPPGSVSQGGPGVAAVQAPSTSPEGAAAAGDAFWSSLRQAIAIFVLLCGIALVLLIGTVLFLLWRAKQLVANAVKPDLPKLEQLVARLRAEHSDLDDEALAKKIIHRQASRAGLVGFVTGLGGLPFLPFAIPIDIAFTVKLQSDLVHMLRMVHSGGHSAEEVSGASLWLISSGGQELTSASGALVRKLAVKYLTRSMLKFLPLIGGVVGFTLNWLSTQGLGRLSIKWLAQQPASFESTP